MNIAAKLWRLYIERPTVKRCDELLYCIGVDVVYDYQYFKGIEVRKMGIVNKGEIHLIKREDLLWQLN
jgi:hypothetical protein